MSMDNGHVIQRNSKGQFTLQMFSMSADSYPSADSVPDDRCFATLEEAVYFYGGKYNEALDKGYALDEYGLFLELQ